MVWLYAGGVSLILPDVRFGMVFPRLGHNYCIRFAMTFPSNHHSSLSVGTDSLPRQLINRMMQEQILMYVVFGDGNKIPFLYKGVSP